MNDREMRVAIAEECGAMWWAGPGLTQLLPRSTIPWAGYYRCSRPISDAVFGVEYVADYLNDLNAMRQVIADKILGDAELERRFLKELNAIIERVADSEDAPVICEWDMTLVAARCDWLAESFLRTLGKLEGGDPRAAKAVTVGPRDDYQAIQKENETLRAEVERLRKANAAMRSAISAVDLVLAGASTMPFSEARRILNESLVLGADARYLTHEQVQP